MKKLLYLTIVLSSVFASCEKEPEIGEAPILTPYKRIGHTFTQEFSSAFVNVHQKEAIEYRVINKDGDMFTYDTLGTETWMDFKDNIRFGNDTVFQGTVFYSRYYLSGDTLVFGIRAQDSSYYNIFYIDTKVAWWK